MCVSYFNAFLRLTSFFKGNYQISISTLLIAIFGRSYLILFSALLAGEIEFQIFESNAFFIVLTNSFSCVSDFFLYYLYLKVWHTTWSFRQLLEFMLKNFVGHFQGLVLYNICYFNANHLNAPSTCCIRLQQNQNQFKSTELFKWKFNGSFHWRHHCLVPSSFNDINLTLSHIFSRYSAQLRLIVFFFLAMIVIFNIWICYNVRSIGILLSHHLSSKLFLLHDSCG